MLDNVVGVLFYEGMSGMSQTGVLRTTVVCNIAIFARYNLNEPDTSCLFWRQVLCLCTIS